jgi:4-hydroxythreonine-4-phosphate dehydrogenase
MNIRPVIAISIGDPNGVGPEITLKSFVMEDLWQYGIPLVTGDWVVLDAVRSKLQIPVRLIRLNDISEVETLTSTDEKELPVVPIVDQGVIINIEDLEVGKVSGLGGKAAVAYIQAAVNLCTSGLAQGIATGPINKEALRAGRQNYIGHTEMISAMSNKKKGLTMFQVDKMKIFFHSRHVSLREAIDLVTKDRIIDSIEMCDRCLASVGVSTSKLAVAGLNPHASDGGLFGEEEAREIKPAIAEAVRHGYNVVGPLPADSVFHQAAEGRFDAVISLFHDQGHIAAKCYDFYHVVSVTFGYPFIRTSVDHGTAFDIAWQNIANPVSMKEAITCCFDLAGKYRPVYREE